MFAKNRRLFYGIAFFQGMVFYGSIATLYRQASGLSVFQITLIESISLLLMLLLEIPWGYAADKIGYRRTIVICNFLFCASKLVFWKADSFFAFLAERLMLSVVLSGLSGCDSAYLYGNVGGLKPKKVFAVYSFMGTAGLLIAATAFSLFLSADFRLTALMTFYAYAIAFALSLFLSEIKPGAEAMEKQALKPAALFKAVVGDRHFLRYLVSCALLVETNQTVTVFLSQIQYQKSGIPIKWFGYLYLALTCSGMSALGAAHLGKGARERGLLLLAGAACLVLSFTSRPLVSVAGILLIRTAGSLLYPLMEERKNRQVTHTSRAAVLSGYSMVMSLTAVLTNLLFGWLTDRDIGLAMLFGAALNIAGGLLLLPRRYRKSGGAEA